MAVKVAINGFGRIGRNILRSIIESGRDDIEVIAINDLGPVETNAHLLRYDSVHGRFPHEVKVEGDTIDVGRGPIRVTAIRNPAELPWAWNSPNTRRSTRGTSRSSRSAESTRSGCRPCSRPARHESWWSGRSRMPPIPRQPLESYEHSCNHVIPAGHFPGCCSHHGVTPGNFPRWSATHWYTRS